MFRDEAVPRRKSYKGKGIRLKCKIGENGVSFIVSSDLRCSYILCCCEYLPNEVQKHSSVIDVPTMVLNSYVYLKVFLRQATERRDSRIARRTADSDKTVENQRLVTLANIQQDGTRLFLVASAAENDDNENADLS